MTFWQTALAVAAGLIIAGLALGVAGKALGAL